MTHPIPTAALDDRLGYVGTSGSGKTYNSGSGVERLLRSGSRVVIPDPLGVWWGLRLDAKGKKSSGFDVAIFGGPKGDLPLTEHAGALIGETVAGMKESCILDLSELGTKAAERRFMLAFLTALYKHKTKEPLHVVFDEADMWAPQQVRDKDGDANRLLGMMETIVRRGRAAGFIPWLITQRPAVLNKDVLSQVDGLIAFKLTSSQDRKAIGDWVEGQADKGVWNTIWASLPTMERGTGVVWLPARGILKTSQFPEKLTFDSSRAPRRGEKVKRAASLKPLDLGALKERLATVEAETKANDPRAMRAQAIEKDRIIARLQAELTSKSTATAKPDKNEIEAAEKRGFDQAKKKLAAASAREAMTAIMTVYENLRSVLAPVTMHLDEEIKKARKRTFDLAAAVQFAPSTSPTARPAALRAPPSVAFAGGGKPVAAPAGDGTYTGPQRRVLRSLAMWRSIGHEAVSREMVAAGAGYSPSSGGFNNLLGGLNTAGAISYPQQGSVTLAVDGIEVMSREQGAEMLLSSLSGPQKKIITAVADGNEYPRAAVGEAASYSPSSGGFNNLLGSLRTLGIIDYPQQGTVQMSPWALELLASSLRAAA